MPHAPQDAQTLEELYALLPEIDCQQKCQESCGPVFMSKAEWGAICERIGWIPRGRRDLTCPMLNRAVGLCRVYDIRPTLCRLWGVVAPMPCPWGCKPERWLSDDEGWAFLEAAHRLGAPEALEDGPISHAQRG